MRPRALAAGHGVRRLGSFLRPLLCPGRVPLLLSFLPVPPDFRTVAPSPGTARSGVSLPLVMAAPPWLLLRPAGLPLSPSLILPVSPDLDPTAHVGRYPFAGGFAKEPSCFRVIEPAVQSAFPLLRILVLKA